MCVGKTIKYESKWILYSINTLYDINDSDREEIVKERLRLRKHNLNDTLKKEMKKGKDAGEENDE